MDEILWLSGEDVEKTGVCRMENAVKIVEEAFRLFDGQEAVIARETALRLQPDGKDQACYALPAYVGGRYDLRGLKWTAHGSTLDSSGGKSRIQAAIVLNKKEEGIPLAILNGTQIGAARTGAVTAVALQRLAPFTAGKIALCGGGGQAEYQLQAILYALPGAKEVAVWSRGYGRAEALVMQYQGRTSIRLYPAATVDEATDGADVVIGVTSADRPYLTARQLEMASLYCHIGYHEIQWEAVDRFQTFVVDTWEEAKHVSGQSLFRFYREGLFDERRITGTLGALVAGRYSVPGGTPDKKIMFDAFGLPIFDVCVAGEAYRYGLKAGLGRKLVW